jgi:hypothetical protein
MITFIRAIRSTCFGVVPASLVGGVVGIAWLGSVDVTVLVLSPVKAISFVIYCRYFYNRTQPLQVFVIRTISDWDTTHFIEEDISHYYFRENLAVIK